MTAPSELMAAVSSDSQLPAKLNSASSLLPLETTQSIAARPITNINDPDFGPFSEGWNVSDSGGSAHLIYAENGKALPLGFTCKKGDGFTLFKSLTSAGFSPGKRILVQLKSLNGSIRIDATVNTRQPFAIESEVPVRTSSLVFVLSPKKGEPTARIGSILESIPAQTTDVKLLKFQSLCDQTFSGSTEK